MIRDWKMHGGLELPANKSESTRLPIAPGPRPRELVLPLTQHAGTAPVPLVAVGDRVLRGQPLAKPVGFVSVGIHAPASGTVTAIEPRTVPHPSGLPAPCVVIATDATDTDWDGLHGHPDWGQLDSSALRNRVREAGIAGLGGAVFPTHVKLTPGTRAPVHTLVLNGAECEPYISCDEMLMRERAAKIVAGIPIMLLALQADRCIVAVEDDKPEAIEAMAAAIGTDPAITLRVVPAVYPQGGERQLVYTLMGVKVPRDRLPLDIGVVCHN
ncbi:MAG: RnfABCDGE type electron transport complex subunit C, partial [Xanthomonadaceae bacterium]|nr:RnfABCDGE type electron transport complex subunit C [Xanthomonadaceae bacterium]